MQHNSDTNERDLMCSLSVIWG